MTILTTEIIEAIFDNFDNWKDSPGDLWHLRHWLQYRQLRTWINDNLCYLTINCDTGQHLQFLRCFFCCFFLKMRIAHWLQKRPTTDVFCIAGCYKLKLHLGGFSRHFMWFQKRGWMASDLSHALTRVYCCFRMF